VQLTQVLMNLAVNARDAMPRGGTLTIETGAVTLDEHDAGAHAGARAGRHVLLTVTDTGEGIVPEMLPLIFEPFFTSKRAGAGTGLGLAVVHGVVIQAGGHVTCESAPGRGTTFCLYFPRVKDRPRAGESADPTEAPPCGGETVLLAEDEEGVRALGRLVLSGSGYTVLEAGDGEEALRLAGSHPGRVDLLVTDVVMPRLGGREVAERLAELRPGLWVHYLSGYTDDAVMRHGVREAETAFLPKPFSPAALVRKVREVLDGQPPGG
jgi:CheY-like chemotaxis protein